MESGWGWAYYFRRRVIAADRVLPNTFYAYNYLTGVYRSTDGGDTWTRLTTTPFAFSGYHAKLKTVPGKAGHLFYTSGTQGGPDDAHPGAVPFKRSIDGGTTWSDVSGVAEVLAFGFGKEAIPGGYPTIFIAGWVNNVYGIYRSLDNAVTWEKIGDYPYGNIDAISAIEGDMSKFGRVYAGLAGSGWAYGDF